MGWTLVVVGHLCNLIVLSGSIRRRVVVGELLEKNLVNDTFWPWVTFCALATIVGTASWLCYQLRERDRLTSTTGVPWTEGVLTRAPHWRGLVGMTILLAINLPIFYGRLLHPTEYPWVLVRRTLKDAVKPVRGSSPASAATETTTAEDAVCGLLVLETPTDFRVWTARNARGRVEVFHLGDGAFVTRQGSDADLIELARRAARRADITACVGAPEEFYATHQ
jgi:hypothetical protein